MTRKAIQDARIGDWWAPCCEQDLRQILTQEDLDDMRDWVDDEAPFEGVWDTQEEALADIAAIPRLVLS